MFDFESLGRLLVYAGLGLFVLGFIVMLLGKSGLPFGRLPGDIIYQRDNITVYFPLVSCLVASILLTILLNVIFWLLRQ